MKKLILILFVIGLVGCSGYIHVDKNKMIITSKTIYDKQNYMYTVKNVTNGRYAYLYIVSSKNRNVGDTLKF